MTQHKKIILHLELENTHTSFRLNFAIRKKNKAGGYDLICDEPNRPYSQLTLTPEQLNICIAGEKEAYYKIMILDSDSELETKPSPFKFIYNITLYGGAFSPLHLGHHESLLSLNNLLINRNNQLTSKLFLLPNSLSNYADKKYLVLLTNVLKKNMLTHYLNSLKSTHSSTIDLLDDELDQGGVSYTADTLKSIKEKYLSYNIYLHINFYTSDESLSKIASWKDYKAIFDQCNIIMCQRIEKENNNLNIKKIISNLGLIIIPDKTALYNLSLNPDKNTGHIYIHNTNLPICSSSEIRNKITHKDSSWKEQVPRAIYDFIIENKLYQH